MKNHLGFNPQAALLLALSAMMGVAHGSTNTVTTAAATGPGSLTAAINALNDGDTIQFNIPGAGVQYIQTPTNGFPLITKNNITIDGYSQPGSHPNVNPLHAANNAVLNIALTSANGNGLSMEAAIEAYTGVINPNLGFGYNELALLGFFRGSNVTVKGLAFISAPQVTGSGYTGPMKAISFCPDAVGQCANWHVSGCWFGVDPASRWWAMMPDGVTVATPAIAIAAYGSKQPDGSNPTYPAPGTIGVATNSSNPRAEFNIFITGYGFDATGLNYRISGNFWNVLPDGMTNFDPSKVNGGSQRGDGFIEVGRVGDNLTIGTDGDGVNDADEGNLFGGVASRDWSNLYLWSAHATNVVIAGNWYGLAVDDVTRFTNSSVIVHALPATAQVQFGSDFDGVSDDLEGNLVYNNNPFDSVLAEITTHSPGYPESVFGSKNSTLPPGARVSFRGNATVNNNLLPYSYADGLGDRLASFTNYEAPYMVVGPNIIPGLDPTNSIYPYLVGTFAPGRAPYTNIMIDLYQLDLEGWNNGQRFLLQELTDHATFTNGFPQGSKYIGSFVVPNTGTFSVNLSGLDLGQGRVVVTANYSVDPMHTHNGRTHTSNFSNPGSLILAGPASVGLTTIVPDVAVWYNSVDNNETNGPVHPASQAVDNGNWEGYATVLGDSTFLIALGAWADDQTNQNWVVVKQPAAGGAGKPGYGFYDDSGVPFSHQINLSRQDGNPPRVAADKRYGAVNFITEAETSLGQLPAFQSDTRWNTNSICTLSNRYVTEQVFALNPATLAQTPLTKAWDFVYGPTHPASLPAGNGGSQLSSTGGRPEFLDNGNIVVMIDDKTCLSSPAGEVTTFAIITPTGTVVKGPSLVDPRDIWDNLTAFRGGFAIRVHNMLYFYDNSGNLQHSVDINVSSGLTFGTGRGDASRIASDIRSQYVYLGGQSPEVGQGHGPVYVAIWDSRTGNFAAKALVQDIDPAFGRTDKVALGVDALDRFCVAYGYQPTPGFTKRQVAARVMTFDGARIRNVTSSFFPFVNHVSTAPNNPNTQIESYNPSVAMTLRQILIVAEGSLNSTNNPAGGQDTNPNPAAGSGVTKVYTIISHPFPQALPKPKLTVAESGSNAVLTWGPVDAGLSTIQWTASLNPPAWTNLTPQPSTVQVGTNYQATVSLNGGPNFFRLARW